ncbi:MAG: adenylate/guanylate cyclase domain-containing protein [Thermodesulfobacteriota bacterium]
MIPFLSIRNKIRHPVLIGMTGAFIAILIHFTGLLELWEAKTWDWRIRLLASPGKGTDQIRIILLDQNSLDWLQKESSLSWPWPREVYATLIDFFARSHAKAVGLDVLFLEPSSYGVSDDKRFGTSLSSFGRVVGAVFLSTAGGKEKASYPIPEIGMHMAGFGHVNHLPDPDAIFRRAALYTKFSGRLIPCLATGMILTGADRNTMIRPGKTLIDRNPLETDMKRPLILRYRGPVTVYNPISAASVIQSEIRMREGLAPTVSPDTFRDKYVLFGFSAPGLMDLRPTPVGNIYPGVGIHATLLDNFISDDFIMEIPPVFVIFIILIFSGGTGFLILRFKSPSGSLGMGAFLIAFPIVISIAGYRLGIWIPLMDLEVAGLLPLSLGILVNYATEGRQKRYIKKAFAQYLSPKVIEQLVLNPHQLKLGGERKPLSIFFSDLQGFTSISEKLSPEDLTRLLNSYLSAMTDIIHEEEGTVDKYEGDAIIAFWNAPLDVPDHAVRAVTAALRCQERLKEIAPLIMGKTDSDLIMRIGINTGEAVVGNMGSQSRFDYTMLGDAVNLASRLEGVNKEFGTRVLISKATADRLNKDFFCREIGRVAVIGRKEPVLVFEPMFSDEFKRRSESLNRFAIGLNLFYQGSFDEAHALFSSLQETDPAASAYKRRCEELKPVIGDKWNGTWVMTRK